MKTRLILLVAMMSYVHLLRSTEADVRQRIVTCLQEASTMFECDTQDLQKQLIPLYQHNLSTIKKSPEYVTIADGCLILDAQTIVQSGFIAFKTTPQTQKPPFFSRSHIQRTRIVPSFTGRGLSLKKKNYALNCFFFQSGRRQPKYIRASGTSKVFVAGTPDVRNLEIWVDDNAECYVQNVNVKQLVIHARGNGKVYIKGGSAKKTYISSREHTLVDVSGVTSEEVIINCTNGHVGHLKVNATKTLSKLGKKLEGSLETGAGIEAQHIITRSALAHKTKRLVTRSVPRLFKRSARCAFLGSKYIIITAISLGVVVTSAIGIGFCIFADQILHKINDLIAPSGEKITYGTLLDLATGNESVSELGDKIKNGMVDTYVQEYLRDHFHIPTGGTGGAAGTGTGTGSGTGSTFEIGGSTYTIPDGFDWSTMDPALFDAYMASSGK